MEPQKLKILAIIGARSGSKGVPHKNIRPLAGKPLMAWIIETAKRSKFINRIVVSTDSPEYAVIARQYGAETPHLRPAELAGDTSTDFEFMKYTLERIEKDEGYRPDIVVRLMATMPLQLPEDIDNCVAELLKDPAAHSSVVIAKARQHPQKALKLIDDKNGGHYLVSYYTESGRDATGLPRQKYEKAYFRANLTACRRDVIDKTDSLTGDFVRYYIIPQERAIDIDSLADFDSVQQVIHKFKPIDETGPKNKSAHIARQKIKASLATAPRAGKNLIEPFKSFAALNKLPFKILEDNRVENRAELHKKYGDLWFCLQGSAKFICGGKLFEPREEKNSQGEIDGSELSAEKIVGGGEIIFKEGDWLWIPAGEPHQHMSEGLCRMMIIKIPQK